MLVFGDIYFKKFKKNIWFLVTVFVGILLFFSGLGIEKQVVQYIGVAFGFFLLILVGLQKSKLNVPPNFWWYFLFLIILVANLGWSQNLKKTFDFFALFFGGGLFWIAFYNLKDRISKNFDKLILILGLVFGGLYLYEAYQVGGFIYPAFERFQVKPWSLYLPYSAYLNHNNIGDLWALVLIIVTFYLLKKPKEIYYWAMVPFGIYFLLVSLSRAAYVSLAAGVIYLAKPKGLLTKYKKLFSGFLLLFVALFLIAGTQKSILFSRQYYLQGALGLMHNPWGVGVGNFSIISEDPSNHIFGLSHFSSVAHNIILEILSGMGILGIIFVLWLGKILINIWENKNPKNLVYRAAFFTLFTNFFFHASYFIPTMLWLWFIVLGLAQSSPKRS